MPDSAERPDVHDEVDGPLVPNPPDATSDQTPLFQEPAGSVEPDGATDTTTSANTPTLDPKVAIASHDRSSPAGRFILGDPGRQLGVVSRLPKWRPFRHDVTVDGFSIGNLTVRAASLRGSSHQYRGTPRQDAYAARSTANDEWLILAVADGVSDGRWSELSAESACQFGSEIVAARLVESGSIGAIEWPDIARMVNVHLAHQARGFLADPILRENGRTGSTPIEGTAMDVSAVMSTTLVMAAISTSNEPGEGIHFAVSSVAGDSSAWQLTNEGRWEHLVGNKSPTNAVESLPRETIVAPTDHRGQLQSGDALVLMTDGLSEPLGNGTGEVGQFLHDQWISPPDILLFPQQLGFVRSGCSDDRTAVSVWAAPSS